MKVYTTIEALKGDKLQGFLVNAFNPFHAIKKVNNHYYNTHGVYPEVTEATIEPKTGMNYEKLVTRN